MKYKRKTYFVTEGTKEPNWDLPVSPVQDRGESKEN